MIQPVLIVQPVRGCGKRTEGGTYLRSAPGSEDGCLPAFVVLNPPIPTSRKSHRGAIIVDGSAILTRQPEDDWLAGASADRLEKERGDAWAIQVFGMTLTKRLEVGECKGLGSAEDALSMLAQKVRWGDKMLVFLRDMSLNQVPDLPNLAGPFANMVSSIQAYVTSRNKGALVTTTAALWQMADAAQPRHRQNVVPTMIKMLTVMGLYKDAQAMYLRYVN